MLFLAFLYVLIKSQTIRFDSYTYGSFGQKITCSNSTYTQVSFSGTFANIPKVIITQDKIDLQKNINFKFRVVSVTLNGFSVELRCGASYGVNTYAILWFAIDSSQIEVINCFNIDNPTVTNQVSHSNPNALYGFVSLTSLQIVGQITFDISITEITSTTVTTTITDLTNISQVGYQIILGVDSAFGSYTPKKTVSPFTSSTITIQPHKFFLITYSGLNYANVDGFRLQKKYPTNTETSVQYSISQWSQSYAGNTHIFIQIPDMEYIQLNDAFKVHQLKLRTLEIVRETQPNIFLIKFVELNQQYSNVGTFQLIMDKTCQTITINIEISCSSNQKFAIKLNYCGLCAKQTPFEETKVCIGTNNTIKVFTRLQASVNLDKTFTITITNNSVKLTQVVQNGVNIIDLNILSLIKQ